jgi:hypothetical protein
MKKTFAAAIACLAVVGSAGASGAVSLSGTVTSSDTQFTDCTATPNYAVVRPFTVTGSGAYTLTSTAPTASFNSAAFYYAAIFTSLPTYASGNPDRLAVVNNNTVQTANVGLAALTNYFLAVGGSAGCGTVYPVSYALTFESPNGEVVFSDVGGPGIPEPGTWAMMIGGLGMIGGALRRRHAVEAV